MAQATSAADDTAGEDDTGSTHPYVAALTGLPGVEHVAVVDISGQRVLGEWGGPEGSADALLERAREAASRTGRRELEDVVSTTPSAIHLSRLVLANPGHPESVWVGLRLDSAHGSLPWTRAALAGLDGPAGAPLLRIPAPRVPDDTSAPAVPGPRVVPPPPAPVTARPPVPPPVAPVSPVAPAVRATVHVALTARAPIAAPEPTSEAAETVETVVTEVATTTEMARPVQPEPPAAAGPVVLEPARSSSFAPVMVVLPPPPPVPDDGSFEEPAPMPYPVVIAPDPAAAEDEPEAEVGAVVADDAPATTADPAPIDPDEPRVVRRLIQGLRRRP